MYRGKMTHQQRAEAAHERNLKACKERQERLKQDMEELERLKACKEVKESQSVNVVPKQYVEVRTTKQAELSKNREWIEYAANEVCKMALNKGWKKPFRMHYDSNVKDFIKARQLSEAAAVLVGLTQIYYTGIHAKKTDIAGIYAKVVTDYDIKYLPKNKRCLRNKMIRMVKGESLFNLIYQPRKGNQNAVKLKSM